MEFPQTPLEIGGGILIATVILDRVLNWTLRWKDQANRGTLENPLREYDMRLAEIKDMQELSKRSLDRIEPQIQKVAESCIKEEVFLAQLVRLSERSNEQLADLIKAVKSNGRHE